MQFVTIDSWPPQAGTDFRRAIEAGNVLYFPNTPFTIAEESQAFLRSLDFDGGSLHKNVAYRPASDRITGLGSDQAGSGRLRDIMRDYSRTAVKLASELFPQYSSRWKLDYASFRPLEEDGRDLPLNKRNDLLHTDAFPSRPTNGDLILRVFTNIHLSKTRNWVTSDPFPILAPKYARDAGLDRIVAAASSLTGRMLHRSATVLKAFGLPLTPRSPYDRFMLHFHDYLKRNEDFQANCAKYRFNFPPGSTWLTFTDVLPHAVYSGQHALEQTFLIARATLADPERAPVSILERLCGRELLSA